MFNKNQVRVNTIINYGNRLEKIPVYIPKNNTLDEAIKKLPGARIEVDEKMGPWLTGLEGLKIKEGSGVQVYFKNKNGEKGLPAFINKTKKADEVKFPGIGNVKVNKDITIIIQVDDYTNDLHVPGCIGALVKPKEQFLASECELVLENVQGERNIETRPDYLSHNFHVPASTSVSITASRSIISSAASKTQFSPTLKQDLPQQTYCFNYPTFSQIYMQSNQQMPAVPMTVTETKKDPKINQILFPVSSSIKSTKQKLQNISLPIKAEFVKFVSRIKTVVQSIPQIIQKTTVKLSHATHKQFSRILAIITPFVTAVEKRVKISQPSALIQNTIRKTKTIPANLLKLLFSPRKKEKEQFIQVQPNNSSRFWNILQGFANSLFILPRKSNNSAYIYLFIFVLLAVTVVYCLFK